MWKRKVKEQRNSFDRMQISNEIMRKVNLYGTRIIKEFFFCVFLPVYYVKKNSVEIFEDTRLEIVTKIFYLKIIFTKISIF